jgi:tetratricopeptide (TPR) repeat protein
MTKVIPFPAGPAEKFGFQRVKSTYTVREISRHFGLPEHYIRRWTREGLVETAPEGAGELRYDFHALILFRRVREMRGQGLSIRQIEAELRGQLNLFPEPMGRLIKLPLKLTPFEAALLLHERGDGRAEEAYWNAVHEGDCVADAFCNLGIIDYDAGRVTRAFDRFTHALGHDPRHFEAHFNLANLYFEAGDLRLAKLHYELGAQIEPFFSNVYFNLALVHASLNDISAAIGALRRGKEVASEDEDLSKMDELLASLEAAAAPPAVAPAGLQRRCSEARDADS